MSKRTIYTIITPLPATVTREIGVLMLHNHQEMIELNPLVIEHHAIKPPKNAPADEFHCTWHSLTDRLSYLPGGYVTGQVTYSACFHDLPNGLQTHIYAPMGLDIKEKWSIGGNMPGEPREVLELGLKNAPREGLYLREDCDMRCNLFLTSYVKRNLKKSHAVLVERLLKKGEIIEDQSYRSSVSLPPSAAGYGVKPAGYDNSYATQHYRQTSNPPAYLPALGPCNGLLAPPHPGPGYPSFPSELPSSPVSGDLSPAAQTYYELESPMSSPAFSQISFPENRRSYPETKALEAGTAAPQPPSQDGKILPSQVPFDYSRLNIPRGTRR